jgi:uncharacterized protein YqgC (DUF456 family)
VLLEERAADMTFVWALLFILAVLVFWCLNFIGLPGNWLTAATTILYAWLVPAEPNNLRWIVVGTVVLLAVLAEIVETGASAAGVKRAGGSRRGAFLALVGSVVGALMGLFLGIPIPVFGSVIGALVFACLGAMFGAFIGETHKGRSFEESWNVGHAAFWGRLFGTAAKLFIGGGAIAVVFV